MRVTGIRPWRMASELRWGWRGVRARGWRAVLIVATLGTALGASTIVFSAADSFVLGRIPYPVADRLMVLHWNSPMSGTSDYVQPQALAEWRKHTDVFSAVHAHDQGPSVYLTVGELTEAVRTQLVTPGLFETLGVSPQWGRSLQPGDEAPDRAPVALIGEDVARRAFGDPARAVGQLLEAGDESLEIVGVMPAGFRFPTSRERIWRPLDLARWPANSWVRGLFQRASSVSIEHVASAVRDRAAAIGAVAPGPRVGPARPVSMASAQVAERERLVFAMLIGGALCVLVIACANVASLELASALARKRTIAIHASLGASRATLVRSGLLEAGLMLGAAVVLGWLLAGWGIGVLVRGLPPAMSDPLSNPIDLDARALGYLALAAGVVWLLISLPVSVSASRANLLDLLKRDNPGRGLAVGASLRQLLMVGQVALTVALLVGAVLVVRTYAGQVALAKGFDAAGVAGISVSQRPQSAVSRADLSATLLSTLRSQPGIRSASRTTGILPTTGAGIGARLSVEGRPPSDQPLKLATYAVDPDYFETMGVRLLAGRLFNAADPPGYIVVDEAFARRFWPVGGAIGARFSMGGTSVNGVENFEIIGVAGHVRADSAETPGGSEQYLVYFRIPPQSSPLSFVVRLDDARQLRALVSLVRSTAPGTVVRADLVDDRYKRLFGDVRVAAWVTSGFGGLAFAVAMAGVYGVMLFLVTSRQREIGVRLALGASPAGIRRMILGSSAKLVVAGAALGVLGAVLAARYVESLLFGVSATDPATLASVVTLVIATALGATWLPARYAASVDPAVTLRAE